MLEFRKQKMVFLALAVVLRLEISHALLETGTRLIKRELSLVVIGDSHIGAVLERTYAHSRQKANGIVVRRNNFLNTVVQRVDGVGAVGDERREVVLPPIARTATNSGAGGTQRPSDLGQKSVALRTAVPFIENAHLAQVDARDAIPPHRIAVRAFGGLAQKLTRPRQTGKAVRSVRACHAVFRETHERAMFRPRLGNGTHSSINEPIDLRENRKGLSAHAVTAQRSQRHRQGDAKTLHVHRRGKRFPKGAGKTFDGALVAVVEHRDELQPV